MDIHGGPESQTRPGWNPGAQYMANMLGATVILPNVRGSDGYGKRYLNLDNGPKREDSVKDIGALLDWIAKQPDLDASKVAVYGQSYGGYMSLAVMTHYSDRLAGGVERYGISDFITFLTNTEAYRRDNRRAEYGDERDPAMRAVFQRINPMANVAQDQEADAGHAGRQRPARAQVGKRPGRRQDPARAAPKSGTSSTPTKATASSRSPTTTSAAKSKRCFCGNCSGRGDTKEQVNGRTDLSRRLPLRRGALLGGARPR